MLIDKYLPVFKAREYHQEKVKTAPEEAYAALRSLDFEDRISSA